MLTSTWKWPGLLCLRSPKTTQRFSPTAPGVTRRKRDLSPTKLLLRELPCDKRRNLDHWSSTCIYSLAHRGESLDSSSRRTRRILRQWPHFQSADGRLLYYRAILRFFLHRDRGIKLSNRHLCDLVRRSRNGSDIANRTTSGEAPAQKAGCDGDWNHRRPVRTWRQSDQFGDHRNDVPDVLSGHQYRVRLSPLCSHQHPVVAVHHVNGDYSVGLPDIRGNALGRIQ